MINEQNKYQFLKEYVELSKKKIPILKGCTNKTCFCTGDCKQIIGWKIKNLTLKYLS